MCPTGPGADSHLGPDDLRASHGGSMAVLVLHVALLFPDRDLAVSLDSELLSVDSLQNAEHQTVISINNQDALET